MSYNLQLTQEQFGGYVPFIDSAHMRPNRGGLTIDAAQVAANVPESQGQAAIVDNRLKLFAGAIVGLAGTGRWEVYTPASAAIAAILNTGDAATDNDIRWEAVTPGAASNDITVEIVDQMKGNPAPEVKVEDEDIKVVLANPTSAVAIDDIGAAADERLVEFVAKEGGVAGDGIVITVIDPGDDADLSAEVDLDARTIAITLENHTGAIQTTAIELVDFCLANPRIMKLVDVRHGLDSDGTGTMIAGVVTTANGNDGNADIADNVADAIIAAVLANAKAIALVDVSTTSTPGNGVVEELEKTNLAGGMNEVTENISTRRCMIVFTEVDLEDGNAVTNGIDHGRVIAARIPLGASDATMRAALPQVSFIG